MRSNRTLLVAAALAGLAATPGVLRGQATADTVEIEELVVTGTRLAIPRSAVPAGITVLTGAELRERGARHVLDALRSVPGLAVVQTGSAGATTSLFLRGGESDYVQVLVDGIPLNEPGGRADLANLTTDNIERIEIVRGPASVLYGSDAVTGVVQIFTRRGRGAPRISAGVRGGSYGSLGYEAELTGANEGTAYSFAASRFGTDGVYAYNNQYRNSTLSGRVQFRPDDRTDASFSVRYADSEFHYPTDGAGRLVDRNAFQLEERVALGLEVGRFLTDRLEGRILLSTSEIDGGTDDRPDDAADTLGFYAYRSQQDLGRRSVDARANYYFAPATILTAGVELEAQKERSSSEYESQFGPGTGSFEAERANRGYYLQALTELGGRLALTLGARLDDNDAFGAFETFRVGAAYRLAGGTRVRAAAGSAFKEPAFLENFGEGFVRGNPELAPERSRSWEAGLEQSLLGGRALLSAAYFSQRFQDMIQYTDRPLGSTEPNYFNIGAADVDGVELEARLDPLAGLALMASYTWLDSEVEDAGFHSGPDAEFVQGQRLIRRPSRAAELSAAYRIPERASVHLAAHFTGDRDDLDFSEWPAQRVTLDAYTRVDLGAELAVARGHGRRPAVTATLRVDNLFDEAYQEVIHFPARGRTILVGARLGLGL